MDIRIQFSEDSLFAAADPADLAAVDVAASMHRYEHMLAKRLEGEFPGATVEIVQGNDCEYSVYDNDGYPDDRAADAVHHIANQMYEGASWWVYRAVEAAEMIRPYVGPQYLVEPLGSVCTVADLEALQAAGYSVVEDELAGWGEYTHIIRVDMPADPQASPTYYLAKLAE
jgi:hypothetical protein